MSGISFQRVVSNPHYPSSSFGEPIFRGYSTPDFPGTISNVPALGSGVTKIPSTPDESNTAQYTIKISVTTLAHNATEFGNTALAKGDMLFHCVDPKQKERLYYPSRYVNLAGLNWHLREYRDKHDFKLGVRVPGSGFDNRVRRGVVLNEFCKKFNYVGFLQHFIYAGVKRFQRKDDTKTLAVYMGGNMEHVYNVFKSTHTLEPLQLLLVAFYPDKQEPFLQVIPFSASGGDCWMFRHFVEELTGKVITKQHVSEDHVDRSDTRWPHVVIIAHKCVGQSLWNISNVELLDRDVDVATRSYALGLEGHQGYARMVHQFDMTD